LKFLRNTIKEENESDLLSIYYRTGDMKVLGRLYESYMPLVYGLCLKYYKDEELSKDAVMQIFEELIVKLREHKVYNFKSWLYTFVRNHCLMGLRIKGRYDFVNLDEQVVEKGHDSHHDIVDAHENQLNLMEMCIDKLPQEQQKCISLFYLKQKCYKEIVELTGYDINKVKSYIQNGKRNLKICIEKNSGKQ
jgi:RNA polymerase sigma factor (sigma-70 family)